MSGETEAGEALFQWPIKFPPASKVSGDHCPSGLLLPVGHGGGGGREACSCFEAWTWLVDACAMGFGALWDTILKLSWAPISPTCPEAWVVRRDGLCLNVNTLSQGQLPGFPLVEHDL